MIYELREYRVKPGCQAEFVRFMDEELLPFQASKGVEAFGPFTVPREPARYLWIRIFADEKTKERICREIYGSREWEERLLPKAAALTDRDAARITPLEPTPGAKRR